MGCFPREGDSASTIGPEPETTLSAPLPHPLLPDLTSLASATADSHGFQLVSVQMLAHLQPMTLQVQIRRSNGDDVSLDDCADFTAPLGEAIEAAALLREAYVLEVSSPGIGNRLLSDRDFQTFRSFPVDVVHMGDEGSELRLSGTLLERSEEHVQINIRGRVKRIPRDSVISVELTSPTG